MSMFDHIVKEKLGQVKTPDVGEAWLKYKEEAAFAKSSRTPTVFKLFLTAVIFSLVLSSLALVLSFNANIPEEQGGSSSITVPQISEEPSSVPFEINADSIEPSNNAALAFTKSAYSKVKNSNQTTHESPLGSRLFQVISTRPKQVGEFSLSKESLEKSASQGSYLIGHYAAPGFGPAPPRYALHLTGSFGVIPAQKLASPRTYGLELLVERKFLRGTSLTLGVGLQNTGISNLSVSRVHQGVTDSLTHFSMNHVIIPVALSYPVHEKVRIYLGPQVGFLRNTQGTYSKKNGVTIPNENQEVQRLNEFHGLRTIDLGARAGLIYTGQRTNLGIRYQQSFSDFTINKVLNDNSSHRLGTLQVFVGLTLSRR